MLTLRSWRFALCMLGAATLAGTAHAQWWRETFDSYPFGPGPSGFGGWTTWDNNPGAQAVLSDFFCSPYKSVCISGTADVVRTYTGFISGKYVAKASWYVPTSSPAGSTYFILLNKYAPLGPYNWSVQVGADATTGLVTWYSSGVLQGTGSTPITAGPGTLPIKTNQWVDIYAEIDLTTNTVSVYYDNKLLATTPWKSNSTSAAAIAAIDLFCDTPTAISYFDNLCIVRNTPRRYRRGRLDNFLTGPFFNDPNVQRPDLMSALATTYPAATFTGFDDPALNKFFATSFSGLPAGPCSIFKGEISFRARASGGGSGNDSFFLWNPPSTSLPPTWLWGDRFDAATSTTWTDTPPATITRNLGNLPVTGSSPLGANALTSINQYGTLSLWGQDDTALDWAELRLWTCRPLWFGLPISNLGPARIDELPNGSLNVNVTGAGGGFVVDTGDANGAELRFGDSPVALPNGALMDMAIKGQDQNGVGEDLFGIRAVKSGSTTNVSLLPGVLLGSTYRYSLLAADGRVLQRGVKNANDPLPLSVPPADTGGGMNGICYVRVNFPPGWRPFQPIDLVYLPCGECFKIYGEDACVVVMHIIPPPAMIGRCFLIGAIQSGLTISGVGHDLVISNPGVVIGNTGVVGTVLGQSIHESFDGWSTLSNIGSSGQDGVSLDFGQATNFDVGIDLDEGGVPDGATINFEAVGKKGSQVNSPLGSLSVLHDGSLWTVSANFGAINSPTVRVQLVNGGSVVQEQSGVAPNNIGSAIDQLPARCKKGIGGGGQPTCFILTWPDSINFMRSGTAYSVDEVRVLAEPSINPNIAYYSNLRITGQNLGEFTLTDTIASRLVSGTILLGDYPNSSSGQEVSIEVRDAANTVALETHTVILDSNGHYSFGTSVQGETHVSAKASHWLRKTQSTVILSMGQFGLNLQLTNGDCDGDNENGIADYALVSASYNTCDGDAGYDARADLNGDACIDIADYAILSANYGMVGDD